MFQIRIHGRGGQGVVTAAEMLSVAAFLEGKYAQAFPSFGSERMGAPVTAFCRISDHEIRTKESIRDPNAVIVQDKTVVKSGGALDGIVESGYLLINSGSTGFLEEAEIQKIQQKKINIHCIGATEIAMEHIGRPIPNAVLLGSFAAFTRVIKIDSVIEAIKTKFSGGIAEKNIDAAKFAYEQTVGGKK